jgi:outer membrane protein insertion porin family
VDTITNVFDMKYFHPIQKRHNVIGFHFNIAHTVGYAGNEVPPFSRFYMGGEGDLRGYDIRSISPVTFIPELVNLPVSYHDPFAGGTLRSFTVPVLEYVATLPGADLQSYANFEYRIPIAGPVTAALFADVGTDGIIKRTALQLNEPGYVSLTSPGQFPYAPNSPNDPNPLQRGDNLTRQLAMAGGTNFRPRGSTGIEFVVQLPIIQAPFRIYYAYNVHRLYQQIFAKAPYFDPSELVTLSHEFDPVTFNEIKQQLTFPPGSLNYFEPRTTFRFTVSRTF